MNFLKQYLITLTFIIISVWVMPAYTERETLSTLCTALYETGRLSKQYTDITIQSALQVVLSRMSQLRETSQMYHRVQPQGSTSVQPQDPLPARKEILDGIFKRLGAAAKLRHDKNKAEKEKKIAEEIAKQLKEPESTLKSILNDIAKEANNPKITELNDKIKTKDDIAKVLKNLTIHFANFVKESVTKDKMSPIVCPLIDDFCTEKTEADQFHDLYESIFNIGVQTPFI